MCSNGTRLWNKTFSGEEKESGITKKKAPLADEEVSETGRHFK